MEPNKETFGAELPEPVGQPGVESSGVLTPEMLTQPSQLPTTSQQPVVSVPAQLPTQPTSVQTPPQAPTPTSVQTAHLIADDADLIEKEWVLKAKAIVAQTAHDPNLQTKEVGKVKADYVQKRYNKQLRAQEG